MNEKTPALDLDGIEKNERDLKIISPAYAGDESELTAILGYTYQSIILEGMGLEKEAKILKRISMDEMKHLQMLGRLIYKLGARPVFSYFPPYPIRFFTARSVSYSSSPKKMLEDSMIGEQYAIDGYSRMIAKLTDEKVRAVITYVRMEEMEHLKQLEEVASRL